MGRNRGRRNNRGRGGGSRANSAARSTQSSPSVNGAGAGRNTTLITKRRYDPRTWTADKMAWTIYLVSTIVSLAFEPGAIQQVEDDNLTDDEAYFLFQRSVRVQKQTPPSLDFRSVPSERGWDLLKIRSPKQFVAHLLNSDDEIGPIEEELNIPAPASVASKQDLSDLDDTNDVDAYETALDILEHRKQRVEKCNAELAILARKQEQDLIAAKTAINDLGDQYSPLGDHAELASNRTAIIAAVKHTSTLMAQLAPLIPHHAALHKCVRAYAWELQAWMDKSTPSDSEMAKARKALSSTEHVTLDVFLHRYSPMQRWFCWKVVQQTLYSHLSRFLGEYKMKYSLDRQFINKGIALWTAIDTEITPRNEGTRVSKRIALDQMSQGKNETYSDYMFRVEQKITNYEASGDVTYPPSSKELLLQHDSKVSSRYAPHLKDMVRKVALLQPYTQDEITLIFNTQDVQDQVHLKNADQNNNNNKNSNSNNNNNNNNGNRRQRMNNAGRGSYVGHYAARPDNGSRTCTYCALFFPTRQTDHEVDSCYTKENQTNPKHAWYKECAQCKKSGMPQQAVGHSAQQCPYGKPGSTKRVAAARKAKKAQKATAHKAVKPVLEWSDSAESDAAAPTQADVVDMFNKMNKADKRAMAKSFEKAQMAKDTAKSAPKKSHKKKKKKKRRGGSSSSSSE
jgi:hypothetical protein